MHQNSCSKRLRRHEELLQCRLMVCVVTAVCSLAAAVVVYLSGAACLLIGAFIYKYCIQTAFAPYTVLLRLDLLLYLC